jgi:hypothetical protein
MHASERNRASVAVEWLCCLIQILFKAPAKDTCISDIDIGMNIDVIVNPPEPGLDRASTITCAKRCEFATLYWPSIRLERALEIFGRMSSKCFLNPFVLFCSHEFNQRFLLYFLGDKFRRCQSQLVSR